MIEKRNFTGGLDSDTEDRYIAQGDYRYALNCTIAQTENGANFVVSNTKGNQLVSHTLPAGNNKSIGCLNSVKTRSNIYFIYNDANRHSILQYLWDSNTIVTILQDTPTESFLGFDVNFKVTGINLVNDELLYWTDDNREPKKINITTAKNNGYTLPIIEEYTYAIKTPPNFPPTVVYANDSTRNVNYLNGFLFQFKTRYVYDDYEKSAYSPISTLPLPTLGCSDFSDELINNAIDITFTTGSTIVTKIEIVARFGNTGDFFSVIILDKSDKNRPLASNTIDVYRFFNDKSYLNVDVRESAKLFDSVPLKAKSQDLIDPTRLSYGDILEGFDPVDVVAQLDLTINDQPNIDTFSVTGTVIIQNPFVSGAASYQQRQPIYYESGSNIVFGGVIAKFPNINTSTLNFEVASSYGQTLPAGGFTFYLAGTDFAAISKQNIDRSNDQIHQYANTNVYVFGNNAEQNGYARSPIASSTFTINGVPPGKYILRVAGNATTLSDINSGTREYQSTSTTVTDVGGSGTTEIEVVVTNANVSIGTTIVYDLTLPLTTTQIATNPISPPETGAYLGYLVDKDSPSLSGSDILNDTRIELARVLFTSHNIIYQPTLSSPTTKAWRGFKPDGSSAGSQYTYTDHNGFWFGAWAFGMQGGIFNNQDVDVYGVTVGGLGAVRPTDLTMYDGAGGSFSPLTSGGSAHTAIARPATEGYWDSNRTLVTGTMFNSDSIPIKGISVIIARGKTEKTLSDGTYSIAVYANSNINAIGAGRADNIYFSSNGTCVGTFTPASDFFNIGFIQNGGTLGQINFSSPYQGVYNYALTDPTSVQIANATVEMLGFTSSTSSLKRGGWYQYGIVYYDHANRSGLTNTNDLPSLTTSVLSGDTDGMKLYVPFYTEIDPNTTDIYGGGTVDVTWRIFNHPPDWATHYQWVRTKNMANNRFIQFAAKNFEYTNDYGVTDDYSGATKLKIDVNNINTDYQKINPTSQVYYDIIKKPTTDRVRFIKDSGGNFYDIYFDTAVIDYANGFIVIENSSELPNFTDQKGVIFEVYNPKLQLETGENLFWEIGECYEILTDLNGLKYHTGPIADQAGSYHANGKDQQVSAIPARGVFTTGDTYYRLRNMPVGLSGTSPAFKLAFIEDGSVSDFYSSKVINIGRPNKVDPDFRQIRRPSTVSYSELYIPETKINGLSSFFDTSFETYEQKYGSIQKLYYENHNLIMFQELKVSQIPVNLTVIFDNASQSVVGASAKVLNQAVPYAGEFGIGTNPESFAVYGLSKYFCDENRMAVLRLDRNGIIPISDYKMHGDFIRFFTEQVGSKYYGAYDIGHKKYILSREDDGKTVSFNEATNKWESYYSYLPEFMGSSKNNLISFKNGGLWNHNSNVYNNFYGVQYSSEIHTVFNADPSKKKVFLSIGEETPDVWTAEFVTPGGQESNLITEDFEEKEGFQYAALLFDTNTPNVSDPLNEGDPLRDTTVLVKLTNTSTEYTKLFAVDIVYENSERSNK